jgi:hypothetical protein
MPQLPAKNTCFDPAAGLDGRDMILTTPEHHSQLRRMRKWHFDQVMVARKGEALALSSKDTVLAQVFSQHAGMHLLFVQALNSFFNPTDNDHL